MTKTQTPKDRSHPFGEVKRRPTTQAMKAAGVDDPIYHGHGFGLRQDCPKCDAYRRAFPCPPRDLGEKFYD